jgi:hypothetical protein
VTKRLEPTSLGEIGAAHAGLRILEIPVPQGRRLAGKSNVAGTVGGTIKEGYRILATFIRILCENRRHG